MWKIGLIAALAFTTVAHAEPGPVGLWLMNEPASMWTLGMARLERYVYGWNTMHPLGSYPVGVGYDWDENRITIWANVSEPFDKNKCSMIVEEIRKSGHVVEGKILLAPLRKSSTYADFFGPIGFGKPSAPEDYRERLDDIIRVRANFDGGGCEGSLVSTEVLYSVSTEVLYSEEE